MLLLELIIGYLIVDVEGYKDPRNAGIPKNRRNRFKSWLNRENDTVIVHNASVTEFTRKLIYDNESLLMYPDQLLPPSSTTTIEPFLLEDELLSNFDEYCLCEESSFSELIEVVSHPWISAMIVLSSVFSGSMLALLFLRCYHRRSSRSNTPLDKKSGDNNLMPLQALQHSFPGVFSPNQ